MITTFISPTLQPAIMLSTMAYRSPAPLRFAFECVPPTRQAMTGRSSATAYRETSMKSLSTRCQQFSSLSTSEWCKKMNSSKICLNPKPTSFPGFAFLLLPLGRGEKNRDPGNEAGPLPVVRSLDLSRYRSLFNYLTLHFNIWVKLEDCYLFISAFISTLLQGPLPWPSSNTKGEVDRARLD